MRVAAVIFDMDGLMIDTETPVQACCQTAAAEMGFDLDDAFYVSSLVGRDWNDCRQALTSRFGPTFDYPAFSSRFQVKWVDHLRPGGIAVKAGFPELLAFIRGHRIPVAIATSTHAADARASLLAAGISEPFDAFVTGDQVERGKPEPEIYLRAAALLQVAPSSCVALEDSSPGVLAATRAGMTTFMVPDNGRPPTADAVQAAFRVMPSLHEVRAFLSEWLDRS